MLSSLCCKVHMYVSAHILSHPFFKKICFFHLFFSLSAGELRTADAARGLEGKNLCASCCYDETESASLRLPSSYLFIIFHHVSCALAVCRPSSFSVISWVNSAACLNQQRRNVCDFTRLKITVTIITCLKIIQQESQRSGWWSH